MKNKFELEAIRISYILNNACNLYCKHCFENSEYRHGVQLSIEDALKATQFVITHNTNTSKEIEITFIGGEPVLYDKFIEFKKCFDLLFENGYSIKILRIYTNGTAYPEELIELLDYISEKGYRDKILFVTTKDFLSNSPMRIDIHGNSMNDVIDKNMELIRQHGYEVFVQYVFGKHDVKNYPRILEEIYKNKDIDFDYAYPCNPDSDLNEDDFNFMIDELYKFTKNHETDYDFYRRCGMELLFCVANDIEFYYEEPRDNIHCNPIKGEFSISPKGYVIPCVKLIEKENEFSHLKIDEITKNPDLLFKNKQLLNIVSYEDKNEEGQKCRECIFYNFCHRCRLHTTLIDFNQNKHIEHHKHQCERIFTFCRCVLNKLKEYKEWQTQKY